MHNTDVGPGIYLETKHRRISTPIPHPDDLISLDELRKVESNAVPKQLPVWDWETNGFSVCDRHGNKWIDFTSGIFVANMGHQNYMVGQAIVEECVFHSYSFVNESRLDFLKKLIEITPAFAEKACLFSAGTEATEAAVKVMRGWSELKHGIRYGSFLSLKGAMHGNTYLMQRLGDKLSLKGLRDEICACDDLSEILFNLEARVGVLKGVMIESYTGWSAKFHDIELIQKIVAKAKQIHVPVCFDEIQGGFGRTGKMFAYEHYEVEPDLVCLGKGLTGSLPVSAVIGRAELMDCLPEGELSSTHSGNPVGCAAGLANLEDFSKDDFKIVDDARMKGAMLHERLGMLKAKYPGIIVEINGEGLLAGIITKTKEQSDLVCGLAKQRGLLLVHTGRESIKIGPPLTIPTDALMEGIGVIDECLGML